MPGLAQTNYQQFTNESFVSGQLSCSNGSVSANGFWSNPRDDVNYCQLQKFWGDLSIQDRQELLRIDKQTLFEQTRRNMYCSRCNGLLLEGFMQIVMYGKSLHLEGTGKQNLCLGPGTAINQNNSDLCTPEISIDEAQDPSVHPWGGLTSTKDGMLTLLDCYLFSTCLIGLQNVFDSARARERERELLYPYACGGAGRGWISQGMMGYSRGHGTRETCALHTTRLSVDTLVDFWSALGDETQQSLLRMKEEDFIERLMYRFDSKRFCRDCRRNVIREFKELKELKRTREPRCSSWFCAADTAFQYEVSHDSVQADWQQSFTDNTGAYHHYEWAIGTGEGKSDILEFENAGMSGKVHVSGLNLDGLNACYITLRAWRMDGRCTELSVKAHALKGQQCVHCRLMVGDGYVTITRGDNIRRFFEHAEEAEEEEDDDSVDKDGNELDGGCSRPQKHAKSPELAREFLVDAATVIFKEQVEKAFREGTARQNAHSIFVCLALKLLEDRLHVACKEIITLEKQTKLLEEEEKEKQEEEEKKERRRAKERDKKLRRKERLREKDKEKKSFEESSSESSQSPTGTDVSKEEVLINDDDDEDEDDECNLINNEEEVICGSDEAIPCVTITSNMGDHTNDGSDMEPISGNGKSSHSLENLNLSHQKMACRKDFEVDPNLKCTDMWRLKVASENGVSGISEPRQNGCDTETLAKSTKGMNTKQLRSSSTIKLNGKNNNGHSVERLYCPNCRVRNNRYDFHACNCSQRNDYKVKVDRHRVEMKEEHAPDMSKPFYRANKVNPIEHTREYGGRLKPKPPGARKVWEPMESQKKHPNNSNNSEAADEAIGLSSSSTVDDQSVGNKSSSTLSISSVVVVAGCGVVNEQVNEATNEDDVEIEVEPCINSMSGSDNCSSSEGDKITPFSSSPNPDSSSSSSDSDDAPVHVQNSNNGSLDKKDGTKEDMERGESNMPIRANVISGQQHHQGMVHQQIHSQRMHVPIFQAPSTIGYYHQVPPPVPWPYHHHHPVFTTPIGYGINGNPHYIQYGSSLHLPPSMVVSPGPLPDYQPIARSNNNNSNGMESLNQTKMMMMMPKQQTQPSETHKEAELQPTKRNNENSGFSLFHFGGPAGLSNHHNVGSKEGLVEELSSKFLVNPVGVDGCDKKENNIMEEYNLFAAAGNGIRFSFL
ncbi:uncharacterized protein LOC124928979 [Impatiens glandulifera]|uniref:uncharacterized protein LOC124928979 n=1 Tax=Impatiens glandulifera TaxID=253017 RepID=UPI001FB153E6|nr:uncharacterized protein LOC124928979 [Impatiens glandulifera]